MLQLEPGMMIWTWVTFFVLLVVLSRVAWKPLLSAVENREKSIADSLKKAEEASADAQKLLEEQQRNVQTAQESIQKMMKENKDLAEKIKNEMLERARAEAQKLQQRAKEEIERETEAAILKLKTQVADLAIQAASRLLQENLNNKKQRDLIDLYIKELDQLDKN